jgi:hypothetical protein
VGTHIVVDTPGEDVPDAVRVAQRSSKKRARAAVRSEASIIADLVLDAILPAIDEAVAELQRELIGTDWIRTSIIKGVDREAIQKVAYQEIMRGQLALGKSDVR